MVDNDGFFFVFFSPFGKPVFRQFYMRRTKKIQKISQPFFLTIYAFGCVAKHFGEEVCLPRSRLRGRCAERFRSNRHMCQWQKPFGLTLDSVSRHHDERQRTDSAGPGLSRCRSRVIGTYSTVVSYVCSRTRLQMQMSLLSVIQV